MTRAVIVRQFGAPDSFRLEQHESGPLQPGDVRVAIKAAGVSYVDVLTAMGQYQFKPPLPFIPGSEFAGIVEALGEGVSGFAPGDEVFGSGLGGIFAERANFKASSLSRVPTGMTLETAALLPVNYMTAYHALVDRARAQPGEALLVLGAAGGTGFGAIQIGKHLGLRVIASASSEEKRRTALEGGADAVIVSGAADWRDQAKNANNGRAIDIVFDPVGGDATELAFRTLGYGGRHLVVGFPAGIPALKTNLALLKSAALMGVHLRHFSMEHPEQARANRESVLSLAARGVLRPAIARRYPIEAFADAMRDAFSGKSAGRIVLSMP